MLYCAPTYRFAFPGDASAAWDEILGKALGQWDDMTDIRYCWSSNPGQAMTTFPAFSEGPDVRIAVVPRAGAEAIFQQATVRLAANPRLSYSEDQLRAVRPYPAFLVSYVYLRWFLKRRKKLCFRDWVLDSGAFSAKNSGIEIRLDEFNETARELLATDPQLTEVFALDVIGDWRGSLKNCEAAWQAGVPAIPTFHVGSPEEALLIMARDYPKIALGGAVGYRHRGKWAKKCFARVWPKPIHGFGFGEEALVLALPWHSVDCSSWASPFRYGQWQSMGGRNLGIRGTKAREIGIRAEFEHYAKIERRAQALWKKQLASLDYIPLRTTQRDIQ